MKKITSLILAIIFTIVIMLGIVNTAMSKYNTTGNSYALLGPPPPPPPGDGDGE